MTGCSGLSAFAGAQGGVQVPDRVTITAMHEGGFTMTDGTQRTLENAAQQVLRHHFAGVLSTHSVEYPGYPFGSVVPFCLDESGQPLILISGLAQHTRNIVANPKVALTLLEKVDGNIQQDARLTLLADAVEVASPEASATRYSRYFPSAQGYHDQLDFRFFRLKVLQLRYIAGFGRMQWLAPHDVLLGNPFTPEREGAMVGHMNEDHADALRRYCEQADIDHIGKAVAMAGMDGQGMILRVDDCLHFIPFDRPVTTPDQARAVLVEMARR